MVKAILDGRKKVTRRLVKPQPFVSCEGLENECRHEAGFFDTGGNHWACRKNGCGIMMNGKSTYHSPYEVGDILYVRETYANISGFTNYADYEIDSDLKYLFKCDDNGEEHAFVDIGVKRWRPSIHMPKEAARIFLRVIDVRVERLQDMQHDAPAKEGIHFQSCPDGFSWKSKTSIDCCYINPMGAFRALWNTTVSEDWQKFESNPWVWVIEFERIEKPIEN